MGGVQEPGPAAGTALDRLAGALVAGYDWRDHGFGASAKAPEGEALEVLLALGVVRGTPHARKAALMSLSAMPQTEVFDAVEGGFFRACGKARWREPVFEKPLLENAQMLSAYASAFALTGLDEHRRAAQATAAFIDRSLTLPQGDLWAQGQVADEEYFALMSHRRSMRGAPRVEASTTLEACAAAAAAFARAGLALSESKLVARAQLAAGALFDVEGVAQARPPAVYRAGQWDGQGGPPATTGAACAAFEVFCATGGDAWLDRAVALCEPVARALGGGAPAGEAGRSALLVQRVGACAGREDLVSRGASAALAVAARGAPAMPQAAPLAAAVLAAACGVLVVEAPSPRGAGADAQLARAALAMAMPRAAFALGRTRGQGAVTFRLAAKRSGVAADAKSLAAALAGVAPAAGSG